MPTKNCDTQKPDNHDTYGARTRLEWTCLQEDTNDALREQERSGLKKQFKEPEFQRVKFENIQEEIDRANQDENRTQIIIASCPSQIGNDDQTMQQVEAMVGSSLAVTKCFSYYGNAVSMIDEARMPDPGTRHRQREKAQAQAQVERDAQAQAQAEREAQAQAMGEVCINSCTITTNPTQSLCGGSDCVYLW